MNDLFGFGISRKCLRFGKISAKPHSFFRDDASKKFSSSANCRGIQKKKVHRAFVSFSARRGGNQIRKDQDWLAEEGTTEHAPRTCMA